MAGGEHAALSQRIVVGVDGSPGARAAVAWCAQHAAELGAEIIAVHALDPVIALVPPAGMATAPGRVEADRARLEEIIDAEWCAALAEVGAAHRTRIVDGPAAAALEQVASEEGASVIVVGRRGTAGPLASLVGSVPRRLAQHAARPVLIVPTG